MTALLLDEVAERIVEGLSPARAELWRLQEELALARRDVDECWQPVQGLQSTIAEMTAAEAELGECRSADDAELGSWLAGGCVGKRPLPSSRTIAAEKRYARLALDGAAASSALPGLEARAHEAS